MSVRRAIAILVLGLVLISVQNVRSAEMPKADSYTNSIGMKFVRVKPGTFRMGQLTKLRKPVLPEIEGGGRGGLFDLQAEGDWDEKPTHTVEITKPFYVGVFEVTNYQYELFDPSHKGQRGRHDISSEDDEAVVYVNWYDAQAFCDWLSDIEGLPYRLATEAEWEYACRAGTNSNFSTGETLTEQYKKGGRDKRPQAKLQVGQTPANQWGIHDMHGNVEEWCNDWYGPYVEGTQKDPVGYAQGDFRVTRSGSYGTYDFFLRSANRMSMLPGDRNWAIGFRVVLGELPDTKPLAEPDPPMNQQNVKHRDPERIKKGPDPDKPYFTGPKVFMKIGRGETGPLFAGHNHNPALAECPNGDLLMCWYTCVSEKDRELGVAASRLVYGENEWQDASPFWDAADRNDHAPVLWYGDDGIVYHFQPYSALSTYANVAVAMRTSTDSGATWSRPRVIIPDHKTQRGIRGGHQLSEPVFRMIDGAIALTTDGFPTLWISHDEGLTFKSCGGDINGNHPGVAQLADGTLIGFLRGSEVPYKDEYTEFYDMGKKYVHMERKHRMPRCISKDGGVSWVKTHTPFGSVEGGERLVLINLRQGGLFLASFANRGMIITDSSGAKRQVHGMFAALSEDGGKTWPYVRLVSDDGPGTPIMTTNGGYCVMSARSAEYRGYMTGCEGLDGVIHLASSFSHYSFNKKWLMTPPPPLKHPPYSVKAAKETFDGPDKFDLDGWEPYHGHGGGFNGKGQYTIISRSHFQGMNRLIGAGSFEMNMSFNNIQFNERGRTASPGITIWVKDAMLRRLHFYIRDDRVDMGMAEEVDPAPQPRERDMEKVEYTTPPTSAKLKFIYNEEKKQFRIFYGLNGDEATTEFPWSKLGIFTSKPFSEATAAYIMFSNGSVDVDHWEIKPL